WSGSGKNRLKKILLTEFHGRFVPSFLIEKPAEIKDHRQFRQFRRLDTHGAIANPAMRGVGLVEEKCADQKKQNHTYRCVDDRGLAQTAVVGAHQSKHPEKADPQPGGLPQKKIVAMAVLFLRRERRSAENHHSAKQA